jgi:single-strand DNA-binding protein
VLSFSVASSQGKRGEETTTWVRCSMFGKRAEAVAQYMLKGTGVVVSGSLSEREYDGKNGKGKSLDLRVNELKLMGGGKRDGGQSGGGSRTQGGGFSDEDYAGGDSDALPF